MEWRLNEVRSMVTRLGRSLVRSFPFEWRPGRRAAECVKWSELLRLSCSVLTSPARLDLVQTSMGWHTAVWPDLTRTILVLAHSSITPGSQRKMV